MVSQLLGSDQGNGNFRDRDRVSVILQLGYM